MKSSLAKGKSSSCGFYGSEFRKYVLPPSGQSFAVTVRCIFEKIKEREGGERGVRGGGKGTTNRRKKRWCIKTFVKNNYGGTTRWLEENQKSRMINPVGKLKRRACFLDKKKKIRIEITLK